MIGFVCVCLNQWSTLLTSSLLHCALTLSIIPAWEAARYDTAIRTQQRYSLATWYDIIPRLSATIYDTDSMSPFSLLLDLVLTLSLSLLDTFMCVGVALMLLLTPKTVSCWQKQVNQCPSPHSLGLLSQQFIPLSPYICMLWLSHIYKTMYAIISSQLSYISTCISLGIRGHKASRSKVNLSITHKSIN